MTHGRALHAATWLFARLIPRAEREHVIGDLEAKLDSRSPIGPRRETPRSSRRAAWCPRATFVTHYLAKALKVVGVACFVGLGLAVVFSRLLSSMFYGVSPSDPITLGTVLGIVVIVAAIGAVVPFAARVPRRPRRGAEGRLRIDCANRPSARGHAR